MTISWLRKRRLPIWTSTATVWSSLTGGSTSVLPTPNLICASSARLPQNSSSTRRSPRSARSSPLLEENKENAKWLLKKKVCIPRLSQGIHTFCLCIILYKRCCVSVVHIVWRTLVHGVLNSIGLICHCNFT